MQKDGGFYHVYNAVWRCIQVNRVDPGRLGVAAR